MKPVNVGLLGLGTVGCGTVNVLSRNAEEITRRAGRGICVTHAAARNLDSHVSALLKVFVSPQRQQMLLMTRMWMLLLS